MLLVLLAKQKNEEASLLWQSLAGKAVIPAEVVLPPPEAGGQARRSRASPAPSLRSGEGSVRLINQLTNRYTGKSDDDYT